MKKEALKTFDILHVHSPFRWNKPHRWLSAAIRGFESLRFGDYSWASHTAFVVIHEDGNAWVYEADPKVKCLPLEKWVKDKQVVITRVPIYKWNYYNVNPDDIRDCARNYLDTGYDFLGLLLFQPLYILTGKWFGSRSANRVYCSEYVATVSNTFFGSPETPYQINPAQLYELMRSWAITDKINANSLL